MRHPALTRFFAAFLAVMSAITLISGAVCIRKAGSSREKQNTDAARLGEKTAEARALRAEIDAMAADYEELNVLYDAEKESNEAERLSYRKDLSIYTATEAALKQGREQLEEGYAALRMGWIEHDNGEKALDEAEAQFQPGYEQYLAGKAQLEEGKRQLEEAEALRDSLPDLGLLRASLEALKASRNEIGAEVDALQRLRENPPRDPETGEVDTAALQTQLDGHVRSLSGKLSGIRSSLEASYTPEELESALAPTAAALGAQAQRLADGSLSAEELLALAEELSKSEQGLSLSFDGAIARADETLTMLESLPEMRAQLEQAEAALQESEPAILQAKEAFEEGRRQLDKAKDMLIYAEAQLIAGKKELEEKEAELVETKEELEGRKSALESQSKKLDEMLRRVEDYREKKDRFGNLRYALFADEGIAARQRAGEDLIEGAERELAQRQIETQREYELRLAAAIGMLAAAFFGILTVPAAFRDKRRFGLPLCAALAFLLAAAAEGVSCYAGRGMIYTVLFVGLFAAPILFLNLKKA